MATSVPHARVYLSARFWRGVVALVAAGVLGGCGRGGSDSGAGSDGKPVVFVSVLPQASIVEEVAAGHFAVHALVGTGQDPHLYAISPQQVIALGKAECLFTVGMPFEEPLVAKIADHGGGLRIVDTTAGIGRLPESPHGDAHHDGHDDHDHGGHALDPHVWTAPLLIKQQATVISDALAKIDPEHAADFRAALADFSDTLDALHAELAAQLAPYRGRRFYVFHPGFGYFADAFGLEQMSVQIGGQSPTAKELTDFIRHAREDGIEVLFVQPQFDPRAATRIADELGARVVVLDPLAEDVLGNLRAAGDALAAAFGAADRK